MHDDSPKSPSTPTHEGHQVLEGPTFRSEAGESYPQDNFPPPQATSKLAICSCVGLLSIVFNFLTAIPAVICGHIALYRIKRAKESLSGKEMAIAGLVMVTC